MGNAVRRVERNPYEYKSSKNQQQAQIFTDFATCVVLITESLGTGYYLVDNYSGSIAAPYRFLYKAKAIRGRQGSDPDNLLDNTGAGDSTDYDCYVISNDECPLIVGKTYVAHCVDEFGFIGSDEQYKRRLYEVVSPRALYYWGLTSVLEWPGPDTFLTYGDAVSLAKIEDVEPGYYVFNAYIVFRKKVIGTSASGASNSLIVVQNGNGVDPPVITDWATYLGVLTAGFHILTKSTPEIDTWDLLSPNPPNDVWEKTEVMKFVWSGFLHNHPSFGPVDTNIHLVITPADSGAPELQVSYVSCYLELIRVPSP
jgi:hypothetical protein